MEFSFTPTSGRFLEIVANNGASWTALSDVNVNSTSVPEPSTFALVGVGMFGLLAMRRRKQA
ncbi:MAG: PEP-CTERM sorting domain-containing protein [Moraxellaceae bacterium]|nr:MAG: PEP-CTERM sorting domain-containing protein [Moraxellaceae bacterium]